MHKETHHTTDREAFRYMKSRKAAVPLVFTPRPISGLIEVRCGIVPDSVESDSALRLPLTFGIPRIPVSSPQDAA